MLSLLESVVFLASEDYWELHREESIFRYTKRQNSRQAPSWTAFQFGLILQCLLPNPSIITTSNTQLHLPTDEQTTYAILIRQILVCYFCRTSWLCDRFSNPHFHPRATSSKQAQCHHTSTNVPTLARSHQ